MRFKRLGYWAIIGAGLLALVVTVARGDWRALAFGGVLVVLSVLVEGLGALMAWLRRDDQKTNR